MNHILRLHTDSNGVVWCGQNGVRAVNSEMLPGEFVTRRSFSDARVVRILGLLSNASLIVKAHNTQMKNIIMRPGRSVEVGSPLVCPTAATREDPTEVLQRMWQPDSSARLSASWRTLDSHAFNSYLLSTSIGGSRDQSMAIFRYHPLRHLLGFFDNPNIDLCMQWVSEVLDPRWFVHIDRPNRMTKLMRFLGLTPANFKVLMNDLEAEDGLKGLRECHNGRRAAMTYGCWHNKDVDDVDFDLPNNFLWRIYRHRGYGWEGALKASQAFVRLVAIYWNDKLSAFPRDLFDPSSFFSTEAEVAAYVHYMSQSQVQG